MKRLLVALAALALSGTALSAQAATLTEIAVLNESSISGNTVAGPYGTVTLTQVVGSNSVTVDVSLAASSGSFVATGGHTTFAFSLASGFADAAINILSSSQTFGSGKKSATYSFSALASNGSYADPAFTNGSTFNTGITWGGRSSNPYTAGDLIFTVTKAGLTLADFVANANGYYFAADVNIAGNTGAVGANKISAVPLPAALPLFGAALIGLGGLARRRAKRS